MIEISENGVDWYALPASTNDLGVETAILDDSIFGSTFQSSVPGLLSWSLESDAFIRGIAAYCTKVFKSGASIPFNNIILTDEGNGWWSLPEEYTPLENITVVLNGVILQPLEIDLVWGRVRLEETGFINAYGSFYPLVEVASTASYSLSQAMDEVDVSVFSESCRNGGWRQFKSGLKTVSLSLSGFLQGSEGFDELTRRETVVVEVEPFPGLKARGIFRPSAVGSSGDAGSVEAEDLEYTLWVPDNGIPFGWDTGGASPPLQMLVRSWMQGIPLRVRYTGGGDSKRGTALVSSLSMDGEVGGLTVFSVSFVGIGRLMKANPDLNILYINDDINTLDILVKDPAYISDDAQTLELFYSLIDQDQDSVTFWVG